MKKKQNDNWSSLLTDLGLETPTQAVQAEEVTTKTVTTETEVVVAAVAETIEGVQTKQVEERKIIAETPKPIDSFGAGLLDDLSETPPTMPVQTPAAKPTRKEAAVEKPVMQESTAEEPGAERPEKSRSEKKSFFDRFPKMNLFGTPPKESLESVVEGSKKSPSLGGKTFTSNTLEKVPHTKSRGNRKKEEPKVANESKVGPVEEKTPSNDNVSNETTANPWSAIAAQVGALSETPSSLSQEPEVRKESSSRKESGRDRGRNSDRDRKGGRKSPPSMFEDPTSEPVESVVLKSLMERGDSKDAEAEKRLSSMFDTIKESGGKEPEGKEKAFESPRDDRQRRGRRGSRYEENRFPEPVEEESTDELFDRFHESEEIEEPRKRASTPKAPTEEVRGRRGSRYTDQTSEKPATREPRRKNEETKPVQEERTWDLDEQPEPRQYSRRGNRRPERSDVENAVEREPMERSAVPVQKSVPTWDDAIGAIIDANVARHNQRPRKNGGRR